MTLLHWYALVGVPALLLSLGAWAVWLSSRDAARYDREEAARLTGSRPRA